MTTAYDKSLEKFMRPTDAIAVEDARDAKVRRLSQEFGQRIVALVSTATITVVDQASCANAVALRSTIGDIAKEISAGFKPEKDYYFQKHKDVCAQENALLAQLLDPRNSRNPGTIDGKLCIAIQTWTAAEDRRRREEEQRIAEERRRENEARALAEAAQIEHSDPELAAAVIEEALAAPAQVYAMPNVRTEVKGLKTTRRWGWRFVGGPKKQTDILRETPPAVLAKAMTMLPREYLMPDVKAIGAIAEALKDKTKIPGVETYYDDVPVR